MSVETLARECPSSLELQRAKDGTYYWTAKIYLDQADPAALNAALAQLRAADTWLRSHYLPEAPKP